MNTETLLYLTPSWRRDVVETYVLYAGALTLLWRSNDLLNMITRPAAA